MANLIDNSDDNDYTMNSKIFRRKNGTFTMNEFEVVAGKRTQNKSVIPPKYSPDDRLKDLRRKAKEELKNE
jgi:rRNA maturation protein Nop10